MVFATWRRRLETPAGPAVSRFSAIRYSVRFTVVGKYLFQLYGLLGWLTTVPLAVAMFSGNVGAAAAYFAVSAVFIGLGLLSRLLPDSNMQRNEAAVVVSLVFVSASLGLSFPIMTYGVGFADAWFEAVSGVTTTGLSTLDIGGMPGAFLFARGWSQWVGGIGVVVLALAVLLRAGHAARSLGFSHAETGDAVGGTRAHAQRVIRIYLALTGLGVAALLLTGATPLDALVHAMTAVSTGGFANHPESLAGASVPQVVVVNLLCFAGAVSFHVYYVSLLGLERLRRLDSQVYTLLAMIVVLTLLTFGIGLLSGAGLGWFDALSIVVSAQTTAGFATTDLTAVPAWLLLLLSLSMFVGGGVGSTSGGIKLGRLLFVLAWMRTYFVRTSLPDTAFVDTRVEQRRVTDEDLQDVFAVIGAFAIVLFLSWFAFVLYGYPVSAALFEVTSALTTTGLSAGLSGPDLPTVLKLILCFDMLCGRVEVVALLVIVMPGTWIGRRRRV
jgi:trk system potassium uptake protein TrkH